MPVDGPRGQAAGAQLLELPPLAVVGRGQPDHPRPHARGLVDLAHARGQEGGRAARQARLDLVRAQGADLQLGHPGGDGPGAQVGERASSAQGSGDGPGDHGRVGAEDLAPHQGVPEAAQGDQDLAGVGGRRPGRRQRRHDHRVLQARHPLAHPEEVLAEVERGLARHLGQLRPVPGQGVVEEDRQPGLSGHLGGLEVAGAQERRGAPAALSEARPPGGLADSQVLDAASVGGEVPVQVQGVGAAQVGGRVALGQGLDLGHDLGQRRGRPVAEGLGGDEEQDLPSPRAPARGRRSRWPPSAR